MSKTLNTVQELWSHCLYCHICKDNCREIKVSVGPDDHFVLVFFNKEENILNIQCIYNKNFVTTYSIDCVSNTFTINGAPHLDQVYCYFYMQSVCRKCNATHAHGADLELSLKNKTVFNIGIENEGTYLLSTEDMYHVTMLYDVSKMLVSKCFRGTEGEIIDDNKVCTLPLVNIDFSNPQLAAHRIKTMLVFS